MKRWINEILPSFFIFGFGSNCPNGGVGKHIHKFLEKGILGIILFSRNVVEPTQLWILLKHFVEFSGRKLMISTDQEGGRYSSLKNGFTLGIPPMGLTATKNLSLAKKEGEIISEELSTVGVNTILAPSLDVNNSLDNPIIGLRSFSSNPNEVVKFSKAFIEGLKTNNLKICVKHFPGHGSTNVDSHEELPVVNITENEWKEIHLTPFEKIIRYENIDMIMTAHVLYPSIDNVPGTLSKKFLTDILRGELGFEGIIVTDCLEMAAIKKHFGVKKATVESFKAGADVILISHSPNLQHEGIEALEKAIEYGEVSEKKVKESYERIEKFKNTLPEFPYDWKRVINLSKNKDFEENIARESITVIERESILPLKNIKNAVIVGVNVNRIKDKIEKYLNSVAENLTFISHENLQKSILLENAEIIFIVTYLKKISKDLTEKLRHIRNLNHKIIHISLFNPYDAIKWDFMPVSIVTYGAQPYQLSALAEVIKGEIKPNSKLPMYT